MRISDWGSDVCSSDLVDLQAQILAGHRRAAAEVGDARQPAGLAAMLDPRVAPGVHRIDAGRRAQVVAEREIGSGEADRAAAAVAMLHPSLDLPGAAEQLDGLARPAFAQVRTNDGGGVDLALAGHHRLDGRDAETVLRS